MAPSSMLKVSLTVCLLLATCLKLVSCLACSSALKARAVRSCTISTDSCQTIWRWIAEDTATVRTSNAACTYSQISVPRRWWYLQSPTNFSIRTDFEEPHCYIVIIFARWYIYTHTHPRESERESPTSSIITLLPWTWRQRFPSHMLCTPYPKRLWCWNVLFLLFFVTYQSHILSCRIAVSAQDYSGHWVCWSGHNAVALYSGCAWSAWISTGKWAVVTGAINLPQSFQAHTSVRRWSLVVIDLVRFIIIPSDDAISIKKLPTKRIK
jgi:hypothetical protein